MTSSFHQIELDYKSCPYSAFATPDNHYQYTRLPFGLKISSNSFQCMLTIALSGLAILSQGEIGDDRPISLASCSLNKHEKNKPVIEKELIGIYWGIQFFRPYIYGRKVIVVTDHRPLISFFFS